MLFLTIFLPSNRANDSNFESTYSMKFFWNYTDKNSLIKSCFFSFVLSEAQNKVLLNSQKFPFNYEQSLTLSWRRFLSYKNQSTDVHQITGFYIIGTSVMKELKISHQFKIKSLIISQKLPFTYEKWFLYDRDLSWKS